MNKKILHTFLGTTILGTSLVGGIFGMGEDVHAAQNTSGNSVISQDKADTEHYINVKGDNIYYNANIKNPKFKTLVFVHGASSSADEWSLMTSKLSGNYNYIMLDLPGHNRSEGKAKMSIDESANFINDFVEASKEKYKLKNDFTYVGHSLGGAIGVEIATRHYNWLKSTILIATSSDFTKVLEPEFLDGLKNGHLDLSFYKNGFSPSTPSVYYDIVVSKLGDVPIESTYADFYSTSSFNDTYKLDKINKSTLIISADDDIIMPTDASKVLADGIKHNEWKQVANAGHFVVTEKPDIIAEMINDFVAKNK